jgi:hypothetical protein
LPFISNLLSPENLKNSSAPCSVMRYLELLGIKGREQVSAVVNIDDRKRLLVPVKAVIRFLGE